MANELMAQRPYVDAYAALEEGRQRAVARQQQEQANALAQAVQAASAAAVRNGMVDPRIFGESLAQQGFAYGIPAAQEALYKTQEGRGKALEAMGKGFDEMFAASREQLAQVNNQQGWNAWRSSLESFLPEVVGIVPSEFTPENKTAALQTAEMLTPELLSIEAGGSFFGVDPRTFKTVGERPKVPYDPALAAQMRAQAAAGVAPTIGGTGEFGKAIAKGGGEELVESRNQASSALSSINNIQNLLPLVSSPDFISGTLGDARLALAKALNLPGATETQTYFSGIGRDVAEIIKSFGAGTGLSDADREFAKGISGGDIKLTAPAIRKILWLNANYNNERIRRYNQRVSGIASNQMTDENTRQQLAVLHAPIQTVDIGPRPVMNKEEAKLLPPGSSFVMPDGAVYRVPEKKK